MPYLVDDTIAAIASAPGGSARGVVRLSGPDVVHRLAACFAPEDSSMALDAVAEPRQIDGALRLVGSLTEVGTSLPGRLLLWPASRSYTRQPSAEFHTIGSPSLLAAVLEQFGHVGVRAAEPGEFTLRAFLAGRIDLTQAEGVLGVIDARDRVGLDAALDQLAGGLSRPLHEIREQLLAALAELEAGLDFVEEDIDFISRDELRGRLNRAQEVVQQTLSQMSGRDQRGEAPRVALVGPPNAGKSSLFNALVERYGTASAGSIVSPKPGATRDVVLARIELQGLPCELIDTAGRDDGGGSALHDAAQRATATHVQQADLRLRCFDATTDFASDSNASMNEAGVDLLVATKTDLDSSWLSRPINALRCSSVTGKGLEELATNIAQRLSLVDSETSYGGAPASTAQRCAGSLRTAGLALERALALTPGGDEELIAAEIRDALNALGEVVGAVHTEDLLDRIFSQFCIGK